MSKSNKNDQPLAEVFGFPISNQSERAVRYRRNKLCPYNNIVSNCTKNSIEFPLGVCSLNHKSNSVIVCPIRFREDWKIVSDAASFIFKDKMAWTHIGEVRLIDRFGKSAGNIDYVLVAYDGKGRVIDFGSLEVQAVYITGNLSGPFSAYLEDPSPDFSWSHSLKYPKPDFLSSSRKRLVPQIIAKGSILNQWNKKQAVALQTVFFDTLPQLPEVPIIESDFAFFLYDLVPIRNGGPSLELKLTKIVYTKFAKAIEQIAKFEAGSIADFTEVLQKRLDIKRSGSSYLDNNENLVIQ